MAIVVSATQGLHVDDCTNFHESSGNGYDGDVDKDNDDEACTVPIATHANSSTQRGDVYMHLSYKEFYTLVGLGGVGGCPGTRAGV